MSGEALLEEIRSNVIMGRVDSSDEGFDGDMEGKPAVVELVEEASQNSVPIKSVIDCLSDAMTVVGQKYDSGEYLIPDMLASAESVGAAMDILEPFLVKSDIESKGRFVIATVEGDLHDIGKNIVTTILKGGGYEVKDLGASVTAEKIVDAVKQHDAEFLGLSALLTTTMVKMQSVIESLEAEGLRDQIKVLVGGAPTSPEFAEKIGADAHCSDAFEAIEALKTLAP
jgi:5-methyltetrahydrofolate--homocysteine methyltransferase